MRFRWYIFNACYECLEFLEKHQKAHPMGLSSIVYWRYWSFWAFTLKLKIIWTILFVCYLRVLSVLKWKTIRDKYSKSFTALNISDAFPRIHLVIGTYVLYSNYSFIDDMTVQKTMKQRNKQKKLLEEHHYFSFRFTFSLNLIDLWVMCDPVYLSRKRPVILT